jgi:hypothetical protein
MNLVKEINFSSNAFIFFFWSFFIVNVLFQDL